MEQNIQILLERPFAHRGLHSNNEVIPENSMAAFKKALAKNFAIELDVHLLSDGKVVVFHDETVQRLCGINKRIDEFDSKEIKNLCLLDSENRIPLLREVLEIVNGKVPLLIEIKNKSTVGKLESAVYNELKNYKGKFAIQSFNPFSLNWFAKNSPNILRGQLSSDFKGEDINPITKLLLRNFYLNFVSKPQFIAYDCSNMPNNKIKKLRQKGLPILCWTVKSNEEYKTVKPLCDNVIFEGFVP